MGRPLNSRTAKRVSVRLRPVNPGDEHAPIAAVFVVYRQDVVGSPGLHPFRDGHPRFMLADWRHAEVAEPRSPLRNENLFGLSNDSESFGIDLPQEQRGPVSEDVIVVGSAASVDQIQSVTMGDPMLLCVVIAEFGTVVESPDSQRFEVQPILGAGDESSFVVADRQKEIVSESRDLRFVQSPCLVVDGQLIPVLLETQRFAVEGAASHSDSRVLALRAEVERQQD